MNLETFKGMMQVLGTGFNKEYKDAELNLLYRYFKNYDEDAFMEAVDRTITSSDRMPSIKQLVENCEMARLQVKLRKEYERMPKAVADQEWYDLLNSFKWNYEL